MPPQSDKRSNHLALGLAVSVLLFAPFTYEEAEDRGDIDGGLFLSRKRQRLIDFRPLRWKKKKPE
jgi:hypothetical protein